MLAEVIVVGSGDESVPPALQRAHPEVRFCSAPLGTSEAQLRSIAILEASGDIVALRRTADVRDALWLDAHFRAATGLQPDHFDEPDLGLFDQQVDEVIVAADALSRHSLEPSPASGASSAA